MSRSPARLSPPSETTRLPASDVAVLTQHLATLPDEEIEGFCNESVKQRKFCDSNTLLSAREYSIEEKRSGSKSSSRTRLEEGVLKTASLAEGVNFLLEMSDDDFLFAVKNDSNAKELLGVNAPLQIRLQQASKMDKSVPASRASRASPPKSDFTTRKSPTKSRVSFDEPMMPTASRSVSRPSRERAAIERTVLASGSAGVALALEEDPVVRDLFNNDPTFRASALKVLQSPAPSSTSNKSQRSRSPTRAAEDMSPRSVRPPSPRSAAVSVLAPTNRPLASRRTSNASRDTAAAATTDERRHFFECSWTEGSQSMPRSPARVNNTPQR